MSSFIDLTALPIFFILKFSFGDAFPSLKIISFFLLFRILSVLSAFLCHFLGFSACFVLAIISNSARHCNWGTSLCFLKTAVECSWVLNQLRRVQNNQLTSTAPHSKEPIQFISQPGFYLSFLIFQVLRLVLFLFFLSGSTIFKDIYNKLIAFLSATLQIVKAHWQDRDGQLMFSCVSY